MTHRLLSIAAVMAAAVAAGSDLRASRDAAVPSSDGRTAMERYHYRVSARVRPLLLFWISRHDVGEALVTRQLSPGEARYSLLIGSDPDRAPLHINRWGYIEESVRGAESRLVGVMTQSDEESIDEAQANIRRQPGGHPFRSIHATADGERAGATVTSFLTAEDYTFRELDVALSRARRESSGSESRAIRLPAGARSGFLAALADAMHTPSINPITYAYYGRLYDMRRTRSETISNVRIGQKSYGPAVAADFLITSRYDGEETRFELMYGVQGRYAEVPLKASYQPRWWIEINLTLDDFDAPSITNRALP